MEEKKSKKCKDFLNELLNDEENVGFIKGQLVSLSYQLLMENGLTNKDIIDKIYYYSEKMLNFLNGEVK
jgi:hypothetical protein